MCMLYVFYMFALSMYVIYVCNICVLYVCYKYMCHKCPLIIYLCYCIPTFRQATLCPLDKLIMAKKFIKNTLVVIV